MPPSIAVIIGSVRQPRINPQVANFVTQTIEKSLSTSEDGVQPSLETIDLAEWNLPLTGEPEIPAVIKDPSEYKLEVTRAWSRKISSHDAIIFVSPQYNWGYPPALKIAIDLLFNEWATKPVMIVTYGGHGGGKCGAQLEQVCNGARMKPISTRVEMSFPSGQWAKEVAFPGNDLGLDAASDESLWAEKRPEIVCAFKELVGALNETSEHR